MEFGLGPDEVADLAHDLERFEDADPTAITDAATPFAALRFPNALPCGESAGLVARIVHQIARGQASLRFAAVAQDPAPAVAQ